MKRITEKDIKFKYIYLRPKTQQEKDWQELKLNRAYDLIFEKTKERILDSDDKKFDSLRRWFRSTVNMK